MAQEIEKKYLVKKLPQQELIKISPYVFQGYLKIGVDYEVRISNRNHLTVKSGEGLVREENIYEISPEVYRALLPLTIGRQIEKSRFWYLLPDGHTAELDIYLGKNTGLVVVEVEFKSVEDANNFVPPDWFGEDISDKKEYKNSLLAK